MKSETTKARVSGTLDPIVRKPKLSTTPILDELFHALHDYGRKNGPRFAVHGVFMHPSKYKLFLEAMAADDRRIPEDGHYKMFGAKIMNSLAHGDGITIF